jgi:hypothetical protein
MRGYELRKIFLQENAAETTKQKEESRIKPKSDSGRPFGDGSFFGGWPPGVSQYENMPIAG